MEFPEFLERLLSAFLGDILSEGTSKFHTEKEVEQQQENLHPLLLTFRERGTLIFKTLYKKQQVKKLTKRSGLKKVVAPVKTSEENRVTPCIYKLCLLNVAT